MTAWHEYSNAGGNPEQIYLEAHGSENVSDARLSMESRRYIESAPSTLTRSILQDLGYRRTRTAEEVHGRPVCQGVLSLKANYPSPSQAPRCPCLFRGRCLQHDASYGFARLLLLACPGNLGERLPQAQEARQGSRRSKRRPRSSESFVLGPRSSGLLCLMLGSLWKSRVEPAPLAVSGPRFE